MLKKMEFEMIVLEDEVVRSEEVKSENRSFPHGLTAPHVLSFHS